MTDELVYPEGWNEVRGALQRGFRFRDFAEAVAFVAGEEDAVGGEDGGGVAYRERGLPDYVFVRAELDWEVGGGGGAGGVGSAELGPVGGGG